MTRVFLVAPTRAARAGLRAMLAGSGAEVVGEAAALESYRAAEAAAEVVVADEEALRQAARELESVARGLAIVALADDQSLALALRGLPLSGWAIVPREAEAEELQAAVAAAAQGLVALPGALLDRLLGERRRQEVLGLEDAEEPLTARELEVLELISQGLSNKLIAQRLGISEHTVKYHVSSIYSKLGAASRTEAVSIGARRGLITI